MKIDEVFGISNEILPASYVDRADLDSEVKKYSGRRTHIAFRGESKCGKSWLRKKNLKKSLTVQCRYGKSVLDLYIDALSQLDINLTISSSEGSNFKGSIEAESSVGASLLAKIGLKVSASAENTNEKISEPVGKNINDLKYICELINYSGKKLIIEDYHYLSIEEQKLLAFDLKTMWDYGCFVVIIGVWTQNNLLTYYNRDLSGRIIELQVYWNEKDLRKVIQNGSSHLNISFSDEIKDLMIQNSYNNVGILQQLCLLTLDEFGFLETSDTKINISNVDLFNSAAMKYAEQLNALYQKFADDVASGIRKRKDATGIYAHTMAVIIESSDEKLLKGIELDELFSLTNAREERIQKGNLRKILKKIGELQVDEQGRGLIISFNESDEKVFAVDRQLLFYRKYLTINWPWNDLLAENQ